MRRLTAGIVVLLLGFAAGVASPQAAESELEEATRLLASQLRCPLCQGVSIQDSPSELAQEMKGVIRSQLAAGRTPQQVRGYFVERYGEWVLLEPEPRGFNLLVYLLPLMGLAVGVGVVTRSVRRSAAAVEG
jgi:cytochrome c-type biogenesis protein CcmH